MGQPSQCEASHTHEGHEGIGGRFAVPRPLTLNLTLKVNFETKRNFRFVISVASMTLGGQQNVIDAEVECDGDVYFTAETLSVVGIWAYLDW